MIQLHENQSVGKYTVNYHIKDSGFCGTYKVSDKEGNAFFLKFFDDAAVPDRMRIDGEIAEVVHSRKIAHENLCSYVEDGTFTADGTACPYVVMEFIRGELFSDIILNANKPKVGFSGLVRGLIFLDSIGLHHNDINPHNIILDEKGALKIIDFGHVSPNIGGVPPFEIKDILIHYSAPETLAGMYSEKSDVFSVAAVMYAYYTNRAPWFVEIPAGAQYADKKKLIRNARKEELNIGILKEKGLEPEIVNTISSGLALDPDERPSLDQMLGALTGEAPVKSASGRETSSRKGETHKDETKVDLDIKKAEGGGFDDVAGMESLKAELTNRVIWVLRDREKAEKYRLTPPNGMILYGPPGCGKTFFAEKFAEETGFNFILVNGSDLGSIYVHGTQGKIAELFKEAEKKAPSIICFDEFDSFVPNRSSSAADHRSEEVNEFLGQLNNCSKKGIFVIGTTNRIDLIDPAVLRKGRMDLHVEIPAPDEKTRSKIFAIHLKERPLADDVDTAALGKETEGYAAADIAFIVNEAAMVAAMADVHISQEHLLNAVHSNRSSLRPADERRKIGF